MSTTYESAKKWIVDKTPSAEEVQDVVNKLEARIDSFNGDDDKIKGSIEAAVFLHSHLDSLETTMPQTESIALDPSPLIPELEPINLEQSVKDQTFAALKAQLGKKL